MYKKTSKKNATLIRDMNQSVNYGAQDVDKVLPSIDISTRDVYISRIINLYRILKDLEL